MRFHRLNVREHPVLLDCFESGINRSHRDHAAAESCSEVVLFDRRADGFFYQTRADRNATPERLGESDDIRHNSTGRLAACKKPIAGAANTRLYFVEDQDYSALVAKFTER